MASAGAHLPLWDKNNVEEEGLIYGSELDTLLIQATPELKRWLRLDDVWAHIQALNVLQLWDVERIQHNRARPDQVEELITHIRTGGTRWMYHALMRAMALTGQGHLIPGTDTAVYYPEGDQAAASHLDMFRLSQQLLRDVWDHCASCKKTLMLSHLFTFEGDPGDDVINCAGSFIKVHPRLKDAGCQGEMAQMAGSKLLEPLGGSPAPVTVRLYADPGDGKTSFARYTVYSWSVDFLKHLINEGGKLCLKSGCPRWTTMVFLTARDIETTVEAAIRKQLGCAQTDTLMAHITLGKEVVIFIDGYDECRHQETLDKIDEFVRDCQRKGGPTVVVICRTNLCRIDGIYFDRFATLSGFSVEQGLHYIMLYTELCQPHLPQPSQAPAVYEYANQHRDKLKAILCNPLKLHIFAALALRGEIDLSVEGEFNISMLFVPLERYLLEREGAAVSEEQKNAFYRLCLYALLNDIREFPQSLLQEFNIVTTFHVFLRQSTRRNNIGRQESYFTFGHEVLLEFFASRYILDLNYDDRISFLLLISHDKMLRNVQKIVFELLLQEGSTQIELLQTVVRFILILQFRAPDKTCTQPNQILDHLIHLRDNIRSDVPLNDILSSRHSKITIRDAASIHEKIERAFNSHADILRSSCWFARLEKEGTLQHVVDCLRTSSPELQQQLIHDTIYRMLPCQEVKAGWYYAVGGTRWAKIEAYEMWHGVSAWCPGDAVAALAQYAATPSGLYLNTGQYKCSDLWGPPGEDRFTQEEWNKLMQKVLPQGWGRHCLEVQLPKRNPVTGLLSCLTQHAEHLSQCEIKVSWGTAGLDDLLTCVSNCRDAGLTVILEKTHLVLPERLRAQGEANNTPVQAGVVHWWVREWGADYLELRLHDTAPVTGLLSWLCGYAERLSQHEEIVLEGCTGELDDIVTYVSSCTNAGLNVVLWDTHIVIPERLRPQGEANNTPVQPDALNWKVSKWSKDWLSVSIHRSASVTGLLSWVSDHAGHLPQCEMIRAYHGTVELEDLLTCVSRYTQRGMKVELYDTHLMLPGSNTTVQAVVLCGRKYMAVHLYGTASVTVLLSHVGDHAVHLPECDQIEVWYGTAELDDLLTCVSRTDMQVVLKDTHIVFPDRMRVQGEAHNTPVQAGVAHGEVTWRAHCMNVDLHGTAPVTVLLSCIRDHADDLSQLAEIEVQHGRAKLEDLVTCVHRCAWVGLRVKLWGTQIVVPERLRAQKKKLNQLRDSLMSAVDVDYWTSYWVTETGDKYVWSDKAGGGQCLVG